MVSEIERLGRQAGREQMSDDAFADVMCALRQVEAHLVKQPSGINTTAWHEAGHAVAACALGYPPVRATIIADGGSRGKVTIFVDDMSAEHQAVHLMAGPLAEIKALRRAGAYVSVAGLVNTSRGDIALLRKLHAPGAPFDIAVPIEAAAALLDANWARVERVARALETHKELETVEIWEAFNG